MEDIVQRVFAIIFAVLVFFIMPIYMTFEKRDDISYALALKITTNFVNTVKAKGYLTADMYADFVSKLGASNNTYEIKLEHKRKVYNPVINVYDSSSKLVDTLDYSIYEDEYKKFDNNNKSNWEIKTKDFNGQQKNYNAKNGYTLKLTYKLGELIYTEEQIINFLNQEVKDNFNYFTMTDDQYKKNSKISSMPVTYDVDGKAIYKMSNGDEFNVIIRNTNITIASILFDALTFNGGTADMPRVYINYGAIIKNQEYTELAD